MTKWFQDNCANHLFKSIFLTLCEIQEILYSTDKKNNITVSIAFVFNFIYSYACGQNKYLWQASKNIFVVIFITWFEIASFHIKSFQAAKLTVKKEKQHLIV